VWSWGCAGREPKGRNEEVEIVPVHASAEHSGAGFRDKGCMRRPIRLGFFRSCRYRRIVSTRTLLFLAALTGLAILVAFAIQVMLARS